MRTVSAQTRRRSGVSMRKAWKRARMERDAALLFSWLVSRRQGASLQELAGRLERTERSVYRWVAKAERAGMLIEHGREAENPKRAHYRAIGWAGP